MKMHKKGNGKTSTSSTSTSMKMSKGQNLTTDNKIGGGGNSSKKMKRGESSNSGVGTEVGAGQESRVIDVLPPEMVMQVLKHVNTRSLFKCRLVNRQWNGISSGILRNRRDAQNHFIFTNKRLLWSNAGYTRYGKKSLRDFVTCMKKSKNCPYSHFAISVMNISLFDHKDFKDFISYFASSNQRIKCLSLNFDNLDDLETFKMFTPKLGCLLLMKIPQLELVLNFVDSFKASTLLQVRLFPTPQQRELDPKLDLVPVQLPNLKVLRFDKPINSTNTGIFKDLLIAAVNLKCLSMTIYSPEDFQFLHSLGKLHLLKEAIIEINKDFISTAERYKNSITPLSLPKLEILELRISMHGISQIYWSRTTKFLGNLFESSKDTLTELKIHPIEFFPGLQLPTFTKLRKLDLTQFNTFPRPIFHPGIRARDVFPAVDILGLKIDVWDHAFPQENSKIPLLPSVKSLVLSEGMHEGIDVSVVALMCPNLIKFKLQKNDRRNPQLNLLPGVRAIWTHMTKLESLEFDVDVEASENNPTALDSCFTGISLENYQHLCKMMEAKETLENYGVSVDIPESNLRALAERENPSILDMKDLKTLTINPYSGKILLKKTGFFTKLTWISEKFAFKFLPHLKPKQRKKTKINA